MAQWKIESLGISSKDFAQGVDERTAMAGYGTKWRFAHEAAPVAGEAAPVAGEPAPAAPSAPAQYSELDLTSLPKAQLQEIAAGMGIADVSGSKSNLIQAIMDRKK